MQMQMMVNQQLFRLLMSNHPPEKPSKTNVNGFVLESSQANLAKWIFQTYPETTVNVQSQNPEVRTHYMNVLFGVMGTIYHKKTPYVSTAELSKASKGLSDLTKAGFNVEWLRPYLEMVSLERKKRNAYEARKAELKMEKAKSRKHSSFRLLLGRFFCVNPKPPIFIGQANDDL
ncbi:unnamed protein product [Microthlaspi erraticum]|uniref:Uncharacterized protein n=1 Tax=Microthlaspi erraticum TaxID=1685480 RepID=A0A6D2JNP5_9BRAS|nr:unnamed protein product [Microthlaspi erraticum]